MFSSCGMSPGGKAGSSDEHSAARSTIGEEKKARSFPDRIILAF